MHTLTSSKHTALLVIHDWTAKNECHLQFLYSFYTSSKDYYYYYYFSSALQELGLSPSVPVHVVLQDWIRREDGKLSFLGFVRLLHGVSSRTFQKGWNTTYTEHFIFSIALELLDLKNCKGAAMACPVLPKTSLCYVDNYWGFLQVKSISSCGMPLQNGIIFDMVSCQVCFSSILSLHI